jgi:glycosyltransferase involved in cell wall biosynthesis
VRILLVGDYPADPRLGSAKVGYKLAEEFRALGHEAELLLAPGIGAWPRGWRARQTIAPLLAARAIRATAAGGGGYDVIDAASADGLLPAALRRLRGGAGPAVIARSHGLEHLNYRRTLDDAAAGLLRKPWTRRIWYPGVRLPQVEFAARLADALIVASEGDRAFVLARGWLPPDRVHVVPHGVSTRFLRSAPPPDAPRGGGILFCGSWDAVKGTPYLVRAMSLLAASGSDVRLTVLGPGIPAAAVLADFGEEVRPRVTVLPRADEEEVVRRYGEHDLLVVPSTYEGFGMVVVEALSQRLPVVATPVGCVPTFVRHGEGGMIVPPRDPEALASALRRLMDDEPMRRRMGDAAALAVRDASWRASAERTLAVYASAIA